MFTTGTTPSICCVSRRWRFAGGGSYEGSNVEGPLASLCPSGRFSQVFGALKEALNAAIEDKDGSTDSSSKETKG